MYMHITHIHICVYCVCVYSTYTHVYVYIYIYIYMHTHVDIDKERYIEMLYTYIYVYTHIHTHICIYTIYTNVIGREGKRATFSRQQWERRIAHALFNTQLITRTHEHTSHKSTIHQ